MKILVIFTGGTIGSRENDGVISPDTQTKYTLIENYKRVYGNCVEFSFVEPYFLLSENLSADMLNTLVSTVCKNLEGGFDGIIVTHGTDTLQYSAAALSFAVGSDSLPIVMVSANYPLESPLSNGNANFAAAVDFIKSASGRGVFISYKNKGETLKFHTPFACIAFGEADDSLYSLKGNFYAEYKDGKIHKNEKFENKNIQARGAFTLKARSPILVIDAHPADNFNYSIEDYKAVILRPYHSGTLNTQNPDFVAFLKRAKRAMVPVFSVNYPSGNVYETATVFEKLGITPLSETFIYSFMKIWLEL